MQMCASCVHGVCMGCAWCALKGWGVHGAPCRDGVSPALGGGNHLLLQHQHLLTQPGQLCLLCSAWSGLGLGLRVRVGVRVRVRAGVWV